MGLMCSIAQWQQYNIAVRAGVGKIKAIKADILYGYLHFYSGMNAKEGEKRTLSHLSLRAAEGHPVCHIYFVSP